MQKSIVGIYVRVSTQEQVNGGYSIGEQKDRLTKYAAAQDWVVRDVYTDPGFSGASLERPGLQRLVADASAGKINKVLVFKLDRLSRSQKNTLYLIEDVFLKNSVDFVSMTENIDTGTPLGRAMVGILSVFAQLEREQIKERMIMGKEGRSKKGKWAGAGNVPMGYDYTDGKLIMNPYYAPIVRKIFDDYTAGKSMSAIADDLNNNGITTPQGTAFQPCSVAYVLDNVIYTGQVRGKDGVYPGEHVALVDQDKFDQAAVRRNDAQNRKHGYNYRKHTSFLSGLMVCAECGQKLDINHGAIDANGNYSKYVAMRNKKDKGCSFEPVRLDVIERQTLDTLRQLQLNPDYLRELVSSDNTQNHDDEIKALEDKITENKTKVSRLTDLYAIGTLDVTELTNKINRLNLEIDTAQRQIDDLTATQTNKPEDIVDRVKTLGDYLDDGDTEKIRFAVRQLIDKIEIGQKKNPLERGGKDARDMIIHWNF